MRSRRNVFPIAFGGLGPLGHGRLNDLVAGVDERAIQRLDGLDGGLAVEAHFGVHHVLHNAVAAGLVPAGREHGCDGLCAADGAQRVLRWQCYVREQCLLNAQTLDQAAHIIDLYRGNVGGNCKGI